MTLNAVTALILLFLPNSIDFQADYITVVEARPIYVRKILSPSSSLPLLAKTITHPAARSLCDSWASCYNSRKYYHCSEHYNLPVNHHRRPFRTCTCSQPWAKMHAGHKCFGFYLFSGGSTRVRCRQGHQNGFYLFSGGSRRVRCRQGHQNAEGVKGWDTPSR